MPRFSQSVGAGDTLVPSIPNFASMWLVRIGPAVLLVPRIGLQGYWIAMALEFNVRGLLFIRRIRGGRWMKYRHALKKSAAADAVKEYIFVNLSPVDLKCVWKRS